ATSRSRCLHFLMSLRFLKGGEYLTLTFKVSLDWLVTGKDRPAKEGDSLGEKIQSVGAVHELSEDEKAFIREYIEFTAYRKQGKRE
ncbi:hypothetical protein NLX71_22280, partial [Paenibacillus sp. MZ04-78.2]|nr:hypothetical protein [Paenibacillus sp. MZ04-78.2]